MIAATAVPAHAEELAFLGGVSHSPQAGTGSFNWQIAYRHPLEEHVSLGLTYLNEGHFTGHHRDGYAPQLWAHIPLVDNELDLSAGAGPYVFFDTVPAGQTDYHNDHGLKLLSSIAATWYSQSDWFVQLQCNYLFLGNTIDTISALGGVGYRFAERPGKKTDPSFLQLPDEEITIFAGQTIANSFESQRSMSTQVEYRHRFIPHLEGSVAFLYEGDSRLIRRDGFIAQLWATQHLHGNRFSVGLGGGAYVSIESYGKLTPDRLSGILTLTASYRFLPQWAIRTSWNRIVTDYDRDSDVILAGVGYLF